MQLPSEFRKTWLPVVVWGYLALVREIVFNFACPNQSPSPVKVFFIIIIILQKTFLLLFL